MKRGEVLISTFVVGLLTFSAIAGIFVLFMSSLNEEYDLALNDNESFEMYNQLSQITNDSKIVVDRIENQAPSSSTDKIGDLLESGSYAVSATASSVNVFKTMVGSAISRLNMGGAGSILKVTAILIVIILISFVIIRILTGRDA